MKKVKIALWVIIIGFVALVMYQNKAFFTARNSFDINLYFTQYHTPAIQNAILLLVFFATGLLIAYFFSLFGKFKASKTIKELKAALNASMNQMTILKQEVEALKQARQGEPAQNGNNPDGSSTIAA